MYIQYDHKTFLNTYVSLYVLGQRNLDLCFINIIFYTCCYPGIVNNCKKLNLGYFD